MLNNTINHFFKNEIEKFIKQSQIITQQPKPIENPNIIKILAVCYYRTYKKRIVNYLRLNGRLKRFPK